MAGAENDIPSGQVVRPMQAVPLQGGTGSCAQKMPERRIKIPTCSVNRA